MKDKHRTTIETYDLCADRYNEKFMALDSYDESYDKFCSLIEKKNALVIDVACGPGNTTRKLLDIRPDLQVFGVDLALSAVSQNYVPTFTRLTASSIIKIIR